MNPILIRAGAIAPRVPDQDLWLSPDHALYLDGLLVPAYCLVNHGSIVQLPVRDITYWHVELPEHGVLLAANTPCESYLDTGNRADFDGASASLTLHPTFASANEAWQARACAPQCRHGPKLARIHARLARPRGVAAGKPSGDGRTAIGHVNRQARRYGRPSRRIAGPTGRVANPRHNFVTPGSMPR